MDFSHIALPSQLKNYNEVLNLIVNHDTEGVKEMLRNMKVKEIVGIRGLNLILEDVRFEEGMVETLMWNPLHFAVYFQNFELVKYFVKDMRINLGLNAPKSVAETEKDAMNSDRFPEDKLMTLLLAYDRKDPQMLKFLLDEGYRIWPSKSINNLLNERLNADVSEW